MIARQTTATGRRAEGRQGKPVGRRSYTRRDAHRSIGSHPSSLLSFIGQRRQAQPPRRSTPLLGSLAGAASVLRTPADASTISRSRACPASPMRSTSRPPSGGVFKSTNQGTSWAPVFDRVDAMMSIGDVAVAPSESDVDLGRHRRSQQPPELVVGRRRLQVASTPDGPGRRPASPTRVTSAASSSTRRTPTSSTSRRPVICGDRTPSAASSRPLTADGRWTRVLYVDDNTGATDLVMDPKDPQTLFAAMYQRQRKAWGSTAAVPAAASSAAATAAASWTGCRTGCRKGDKGRIGLDIFHADPRVIFAVVEAAGRDSGRLSQRGRRRHVAGVVRRSTRGRCTTARSGPIRKTRTRLPARIEPRLLHLQRRRQGRSRDVFSTIHSEDHALWIDPDDTNHLIVGGDGGVVDLVGPRPDVAVPRQPAGRTVLRDQRRHAGSVRDLRRAAGQRTLVRAERDARRTGDLEPRRLQHRQRRRLLRAPGSGPTRGRRSSNRRTAARTA